MRKWLIKMLAGNMPVMLNMVINRPKQHKGLTIYFKQKPALIGKNKFVQSDNIESPLLESWRDIKEAEATW